MESKTRTTCRVIALALLVIGALAISGTRPFALADASVATDRIDYAPGEIVTVTGGNWAPGENVSLVFTADGHATLSFSSVADENGSFTNTDFVADLDDVALTFTINAAGESSGLTASTQFTDGKPPDVGPPPPPPAPVCGNGTQEAGEACDDGNTVDGDGCSSTCNIEPPPPPPPPPATCDTTTGTQTIFASNVAEKNTNSDSTCDPEKPNEWHFVINQSDSSCPSSITVTFNTGTVTVPGDVTNPNGSECGYTWTSNLTDTLVSASATTYLNWDTGGVCGNGQFVVSHTPCAQAVCGNGIIEPGEVCDDGPNNGQRGYCSATCDTLKKVTCDVTTDIQFPDGSSTGTTVTMGATVHDQATVDCDDGLPPPANSSVTFHYFFGNNACAGTPADEIVALPGLNNPESVVSGSQGPLAVGQVSYGAHFTSGATGIADSESACEPLTILSSITDFYYTLPNDSTHYSCTLEAKAAGAVPGVDCLEASVPLNTLANYTVHVGVSDDTGGSIYEKVQGGLAAKATYADSFGVNYVADSLKIININPADITASCGAAVIDTSSAKTTGGNTGNVVIWGNGTTSTSQLGFQMAQGQSCELQVMVKKAYSSCGEQPVTSSWSETQNGPGSYVNKSPYTGQLSVNVCGQ